MATLWDRQEGEPEKAYAAFCRFRDMPKPRNLTALYKAETGRNNKNVPGQWRGWRSTHDWDARVREYDNFIQFTKDTVVVDAIANEKAEYVAKVKAEARDFALAAIAIRREGLKQMDTPEGSLIVARATAIWQKAREAEGIALGLLSVERPK